MEIHHARDTLSVLDSDLAGSRFSNANLAKSRFDDVNLQGAGFSNASLREVTFANVDLRDASITDANIAGLRLDDVNLQGAAFSNTSLRAATFADVDLRDACITDANIAGLRIDGHRVDELIQARAACGGAVVFAKDLARVQAFYEAVVGLACEHAESGHVVLASPAFQLVVLRLPERIASSVEVDSPPRRRTETPVKLVFWVADIATARAAALEHGGEVFPPDQEWEFRETLVCDGVDPEGNVVQFRQRKP